MTQKEQEEYNKLTPNQKADYEHKKNQFPEWSHHKIYTSIIISDTVLKKLDGDDGTKDATTLINEPDFLKDIFEGAKTTLEGLGVIADTVFAALDAAIDTLSNLIWQGVKYVGNKLKDFWDWLNS